MIAFDIQEEALFQTRTLLAKHHLAACLIRDSHENLDHYVKKPLDAAIFNFGYLPNGDKTITTTADSSLSAVQKALSLLKDTGILVLVGSTTEIMSYAKKSDKTAMDSKTES